MKLLFFNDCIPLTYNNHVIIFCLTNSLFHYCKLKKDYPNSIDGIVTYKEFNSQLISSENMTIAESIKSLENPLRTIAYSLFIKYPVEEFYSILNEDIINNAHTIGIDGADFNAFNLKLVSDNQGILFSLALHGDLRKNQLKINSSDGSESLVYNLFGEDSNTEYLDSLFKAEELEKLDNFDKLINIIGKCFFTAKFESAYKKSSRIIQEAIMEHFAELYNLRTKGSLVPETLLKNVTPAKEKVYHVKELKVRDPIALRIYFYESNVATYIASIEKKPTKARRTNEQDNHIKNALSLIKQMV